MLASASFRPNLWISFSSRRSHSFFSPIGRLLIYLWYHLRPVSEFWIVSATSSARVQFSAVLTSHKPLLLLPHFSARPDTFKIIFRNRGNSLPTFFFLSFYSGAYSSGVAGHTPEFQNRTNYFETPNHFWDLVVHADEGRSRAQPCEE